MRWKSEPKSKVGDERVITSFLILPVKIGNETRWLEKVKIRQVLKASYTFESGLPHLKEYWDDIEFIDEK